MMDEAKIREFAKGFKGFRRRMNFQELLLTDIYPLFKKWFENKTGGEVHHQTIKWLLGRPFPMAQKYIHREYENKWQESPLILFENIDHRAWFAPLKFLKTILPLHTPILDFGAGCGQDLFYLEELGFTKLHYWDTSPMMQDWIKFAKSEGSKIHVHTEIPQRCFEIIIIRGVLGGWTGKDNKEVGKSLLDLLSPNGYIFTGGHHEVGVKGLAPVYCEHGHPISIYKRSKK